MLFSIDAFGSNEARHGLAVLLMIGTLVLSRGASSMSAFASFLSCCYSIRRVQWRLRLVLGYFFVAVFVVFASCSGSIPMVCWGWSQGFVPDGRLPVWAESARQSWRSRAVGYGYNTFWTRN
ncbi:MAG: hypothetical protein WDN69_12760 [Aliidongia sp.]